MIKDLNLEHDKDFQPTFNPIGWAMGLVSPSGVPDAPGADLEHAPLRREYMLKMWNRFLDVKVEAGTRLIHVTFEKPRPEAVGGSE